MSDDAPIRHAGLSRLSLHNIGGLARWAFLRARNRHVRPRLFFIDRRPNFYFGPEARFEVGSGVIFMYDTTARIEGSAKIGSRVWFNRGCHVVIKSDLTIGDDTLFGEYVSIHDETHTIANGEIVDRNEFTSEPIHIGRKVWVGAKASILPGVTIGDRAIVGANAVVTSDVPEGAVVVGAPARVIRYLDPDGPATTRRHPVPDAAAQ